MKHTEGKVLIPSEMVMTKKDFAQLNDDKHPLTIIKPIDKPDVVAIVYGIGDGDDKDMATRLTNCWNACEGVEGLKPGQVKEIIDQRDRTQGQLERVYIALKHITEDAQDGRMTQASINRAKKALSDIKGGE